MDGSLFFTASTFALALFGVAFLATKGHRQSGDLEAAVLLVLLALPAAIRIFLPLAMKEPGKCMFARDVIPVAFSPALYLYAKRLVSANRGIGIAGELTHFIPLAVGLAFLVSPLVPEVSPVLPRGGGLPPETFIAVTGGPAGKPIFLVVAHCAAAVSFAVYAIPIAGVLRRHRERAREYFSFSSSAVNLSWIVTIVSAFGVIQAYMVTAQVLSLAGVRSPWFNPLVSIDSGYGVFVALFSYFALRQERVFFRYRYLDPERDPKVSVFGVVGPTPEAAGIDRDQTEGQPVKYRKSSLDEARVDRVFAKVESLMREGFLYRDGDLTLEDVAECIGSSRHYVSQTINRKTGGNFFSYVNGYRVLDVMAAFGDSEKDAITILDLAMAAGFNSKSSFMNHFRSMNGESPKELRTRVRLSRETPSSG